MGLKQSTAATSRLDGGYADARGYSSTPPGRSTGMPGSGADQGRSRALSLGNFLAASVNGDASLSFSTSASNATVNGTPPDSDDVYSTDDGELFEETLSSSLPTQLTFYQDLKCPVCHKTVPPDNVEVHLLLCLTKPQIVYNEDVLSEDKGECSICLDELEQGHTIARLPCLCIYHKGCIDDWFAVNRSCPEHPGD